MVLLKIYFYLSFVSAVAVSAIAQLQSEDIYQKLSSANSANRIAALQSLKRTQDKILQEKIIDIALFDTNLEVRITAENILNNFLPIDAALDGRKAPAYNDTYNRHLQKLRAELSSIFPTEQIKALKSLKDVENVHPLIRYTVIKEFIFKPTDTDTQQEFIYIAASDFYLQQWLIYISTTDAVPRSVQDRAKHVFLQSKPDLKTQEELFRRATSNETSLTGKIQAKSMLIKVELDYTFQEKLLKRAASNKISITERKVAKDILIQNPYIALKMEHYFVATAISNEVSEIAQRVTQDILHTRALLLRVQRGLSRLLINSDEISDTARQIIGDVLTWNEFIDAGILQTLIDAAISEKTSDTIRDVIKQIFYRRDLETIIQRRLLNEATSEENSEFSQNVARDILINIRLNLDFQQGLLQITKSRTSEKKLKKVASMVLTNNRYIHPSIRQDMSFSLRCRRTFKVGLWK